MIPTTRLSEPNAAAWQLCFAIENALVQGAAAKADKLYWPMSISVELDGRLVINPVSFRKLPAKQNPSPSLTSAEVEKDRAPSR